MNTALVWIEPDLMTAFFKIHGPMIWMIYVLAPLAAAVAGCFVLFKRMHGNQRRRQALQRVAATVGFTFHGRAMVRVVNDPSRTHLFSFGTSRSASDVLKGESGGAETLLFDYTYAMGAKTVQQTVAAFRIIGTLPEFYLRPETLLHKVGALIGYDDIGFSFVPEARDLLAGSPLGRCPLFTTGHSQKAKNVLKGSRGGTETILFDYLFSRRIEPVVPAPDRRGG